MLEIAYMSIADINDERRERLYSCIDPKRREQLQQRRNRKSADQSLAAEALARVMLLQTVRKIEAEKRNAGDCIPDDFPYSGGKPGVLQAKDFVIIRDGNEKPYQATVPGLYFNCSHSGDMVACAVADVEVGVDIQEIVENPKVKERIFCPQELKGDFCFTEIWTKKESYIKYTGEGLRRDMASLYVQKMQEDGEVNWFGGTVCDTCYLYACVAPDVKLQESGWKMHEITLSEVLQAICESR